MSIGAFSGGSPANKFEQLRAAAASIEQLATDYHAALKPVQDALQAVADAPMDDRKKWAAALAALARCLTENGLADVPASRQGAERWTAQFDSGKPGNAFAGQAFFAALAGAAADGSPPAAFFTALDNYTFVPATAVQEVCAALSNLLYVHKERVAPRFTAAYRRTLKAVDMDRDSLCLRLHRCDIRVSSDALAAMHDWDECATGVAPCYTADIRPQPGWVKTIDERVSKLYVARPRHLNAELADAFSAVAVGIRECARLIDSVPYLWSNPTQYRRQAADVAEAAAAARAAYMNVDIRLRRAGGPNPMLEALNDVLTVQGRAPLDPDPRRDGLNAAITGLYTKRGNLFARVEGKGIIHRMLDQLALVPPQADTSGDGTQPSNRTALAEGGDAPLAVERDQTEELGDAVELVRLAREVWTFKAHQTTPGGENEAGRFTSRMPDAAILAMRVVPFGMPGYEEWERRVLAIRGACSDALKCGAHGEELVARLDALAEAIDSVHRAAVAVVRPANVALTANAGPGTGSVEAVSPTASGPNGAKEDQPAPASQQVSRMAGSPPTPSGPFVPLTSWAEIVAALNEPHAKPVWKNNSGTQEKIRKLNDQHNGPIRLGKGRGVQPSVDKAALLTWWNGLSEHYDARTEEKRAAEESSQASVTDTHSYGASGTVVPGVSGSLKPKRPRSGQKGGEVGN